MAKVAFCGDIHFGFENNSESHNQYLLEFFEWMVTRCNEMEIDYFIIGGDFFDVRDKIDVRTLNYGIRACKYIQKEFKGVEFYNLLGNHDLFYRDRLDVASANVLDPYCNLITKNTEVTLDGHKCLITPWITDSEHWGRTVEQSAGAEYMFAHMEFSGFRMNDAYIMEHGYTHKALKGLKRVITGHYHKRQIIDNVIYPGSPFPFDFGDANDTERGFCVLDLDTNKVDFHDWGKVKICSVTYAQYEEQKSTFDEHTKVRVEMPDDIDDSVIEEVQNELSAQGVRLARIKYEGNKAKEVMEGSVEIDEVENIDQRVMSTFDTVEYNSKDIKPDLLKDLYQQAVDFHGESS
jgi:DNA repair exonuclease SbcCD nuclease subunit